MLDSRTMHALLDSIQEPIVFVDNDHVIQYLNPAAMRKHEAAGYGGLLCKSVMDCHSPESQEKIRRIYAQLKDGSNEVLEKVNKRGQKVFVRAVRDEDGKLLGYYERYESGGE